jgi:ClpX C4-type zinc finger
MKPRKTFGMGRRKREPSEDKICDFCKRKETEVENLIYIDEHRPSICSDCIELCNEILKGEA